MLTVLATVGALVVIRWLAVAVYVVVDLFREPKAEGPDSHKVEYVGKK